MTAYVDERLAAHSRKCRITDGFMLIAILCCFAGMCWHWNGAGAASLTYEQLLQSVANDDPNHVTSKDQLYLRIRSGILLLREHGGSREIALLKEELR